MKFSSFVICASLATNQVVEAHGGIFNYTIGDVSYAGYYPWYTEDQQSETIQRAWWPDPMQAVDHPWLACNRGNPLATRNPTLHAPIEAGTNITADYSAPLCPRDHHQPTEASTPWTDEPKPITCFSSEGDPWPWSSNYPWPHALGPMMVYMAPCNGPCEDFDPTGEDVVWFKISEGGFHPEPQEWFEKPNIGISTAWDQSKWTKKATMWSTKIPKDLKPGNYLIRHETIMIELMPPQHYPECAQLTVTGDGTKLPSEEYLVSFPGAYSMDDPGLAVAGDVYTQKARETFNYTIPGPKVWTGEE